MSRRWGTFSVRRVSIAGRGMRRTVSEGTVSVATRAMRPAFATSPVAVRPGTALAPAESLPVPALVDGVEFRELSLVEDLANFRPGILQDFLHRLAPFARTASRACF